MAKQFPFDGPMQAEGREAKIAFLRGVVPAWKTAFDLRTALDLGCGVGYYSAALRDTGLQVTAVDGREENINEARSRHSGIDFRVADVEDPSLPALGVFDLVFFFGVLYHLENPMRAIRSARALTGKILLLESMSLPVKQPFFVLLDEPPVEDQSLREVSCYPSDGAIIKMAYRAGFPHVYQFHALPNHEDFKAALGRRRMRTVIAASVPPIESPLLRPVAEPKPSGDLWTSDPTGITKKLRRLRTSIRNSRRKRRP